MSASLVGSEMCIRDRCVSWVGAPRLGPDSARPRLWSSGRMGAVCCGGGPVSYTHLTLPTICSV
eukprot:677136-Alexandrium_andersonii.AAC.1